MVPRSSGIRPAASMAGRDRPGALGLVLLQAGWIFGGERLKQWREARRPLPPPGSPNVLLIVLDTVRADPSASTAIRVRPRPTSSGWRRGIRFDRGARTGALDARLARQLLHRPMAP